MYDGNLLSGWSNRLVAFGVDPEKTMCILPNPKPRQVRDMSRRIFWNVNSEGPNGSYDSGRCG